MAAAVDSMDPPTDPMDAVGGLLKWFEMLCNMWSVPGSLFEVGGGSLPFRGAVDWDIFGLRVAIVVVVVVEGWGSDGGSIAGDIGEAESACKCC